MICKTGNRFLLALFASGALAGCTDPSEPTGDGPSEAAGTDSLTAADATSTCTGGGRELNLAVEYTGPHDFTICETTTGSIACFVPFGDKLYVLDTLADGLSAAARWTSNFGRFGTCRNALGADHWGVCDKEFPEGQTITFDATRYDGDTGLCVGPESARRSSGT
jgi:hypothetical protein